ncbi:MAG TPA: RNA polymerase sigma factor, partial [Conexibacter sp.]|nr:RNA polymerase sigma factor [Conexibacter sp.]
EDLLEHVLGVLAGAEHVAAEGQEPRLVALNEGLEGALVALARERYEALVSRYQSRLLAFCRHMLGSREDAEDVLQEVFAASFNAILADDRPINARPWLYRIARNRSLNHLRRAQPIGVDSMDVHLSEHGTTTADKVDKREQFRELIADVQELPETQRTALLLREIDALSYEQISEAMETTVPSVKSLLVRARVSLAEAAEARLLSCEDVRIELGEIAEGLRRRTTPPVRRHLRGCERCTVFRSELRSTSKALALLLPVGPLLLVKKLVLAHLGLSSMAGAGGAGGASGAASGGAAIGAVAGGASAVSSSGLISAGIGALGAKAAAGIAAAALVTAGAAVEMEHTTTHRHHAAVAVVAQQREPALAGVVTPVPAHVQPAPGRVQRALDAPARAAPATRAATKPATATTTPTTAAVTTPATPGAAAPPPADAGRTQVESGATTLPPTTTPADAPPPTLVPVPPPNGGAPAATTPTQTTPAPPPTTTVPAPPADTTPAPPTATTPDGGANGSDTGTTTVPAPPADDPAGAGS